MPEGKSVDRGMATHASCLALLMWASFAMAAPPSYGPYSVKSTTYTVSALDHTWGSTEVWVVYPVSSNASQTFPLITYLHGAMGGGIDLLGYANLFEQMASFGFVVAAPSRYSLVPVLAYVQQFVRHDCVALAHANVACVLQLLAGLPRRRSRCAMDRLRGLAGRATGWPVMARVVRRGSEDD